MIIQNMPNFTRIAKRWLLASLIGLVILLPGCTSLSDKSSKFPPLRVNWSEWPGDYSIILADQLGLYEKYGVEVALTYEEIYGNSTASFAVGAIDTFNCTIGDAILLAGKTNLKVVGILDSSEGADAVVATGIIKTPADLKGKRFGVDVGAVMSELFLQEMLKAYDLTSGDLILVDIAPEEVPGAMGYRIDAGHTWAPYTQRAEALGYRTIFTSAQTPSLFPDVLVFRQTLVDERPQDVRAFVGAVMEAAAYWRGNPEQGNQLIAEYTGLPVEEVAPQGVRIFALQDNLDAFRPGEDSSSLFHTTRLTLEYMIRSGSLSHAPDIEQLLDAGFLQ